MFLHDLPSLSYIQDSLHDFFKWKNILVENVNHYNNEVVSEASEVTSYNEEVAHQQFVSDDKFNLHKYGLDEDYFLNRDKTHNENISNQENHINEVFEIDQ